MAKGKNSSPKRPAPESAPAQNGNGDALAAYFLSLSVENVRCFGPKQTLDLSDGHGKPALWTIILGLNGTGKTTLLQTIVGFELLAEEHSRKRPRFSQFDKEVFLRDDLTAKLSAEFSVIGQTTAAARRVNRYEISFERFPFGTKNSFSGESVQSPLYCGYGVARRMGLTSLGESGGNSAVESLFSDKAELRNPEDWLLRLDYGASKKSDIRDQQRERLEQVKDLLLNILPDVDDIRLIASDGPNPTPRAEFKTPYGWVPLKQLGYGYQTLITWVADLANRMVERYPNSKDPLAEPAVVVVDEIDLHLHPSWQRKLMDFLTERFPNTQFIATAHSPLIAQAAANANLAVLRREGDHVVIDNDVDNIRGWRIDQILTSDLFGLETARPPQVEKLLAERKRLLTKSKLTKADQRELAELEAKLGELPTGETAQEVRERDEIRKSLDLLLKDR